MKKIPYGQSDIIEILQNGYYYVDKTRFIPLVEEAGKYLFFLRPRRFGKSLWLATLATYYDIKNKDKLTEIFKETWIAENLTPEAGEYFVLRFNFSAIDPHPDRVQESFNTRCRERILGFLEYYNEYLPSELVSKVSEYNQADDMLDLLLSEQLFRKTGHKVYLLIDEYDNFTNTILSSYSHSAYHDLTHGEGFFRYFFNILKAATTGPGASLGRMFITGVSPITLDDVTSGFNIGDNISLEPDFNQLAGFTTEEIKKILAYYIQTGWLNQSLNELMSITSEWYDNYRFYGQSKETVYNPDMVFYFVRQAGRRKKIPDDLIDYNVRTDYRKLKHLVVIDRQLNGNFSILQEVMNKGVTEGRVQDSFPLESLVDEENFVSHLFYLGLLSFADKRTLCIPNQTVWKLLFGYIRDAYKDLQIFKPRIWQLQKLLNRMAYSGQWKECLEFLAKEIKNQTSIRDYIYGEHSVKLLLAAYLNILDLFVVHTEKEANKGFADIYLEPFWEKDEDVRFGYLIELKYIPRSEKLTDALLTEKQTEAIDQLQSYVRDEKIRKKFEQNRQGKLIKIYQIWHGWELLEMEEGSC
jgi:hypothetical protein